MRNLTLLLCSTLLLGLTITLGQASDAASEQIVSNPNLFVGEQLAPPLSGDDESVTIFRNDGKLQVLRLWPNRAQKQSMETVEGFSVPSHSREGRPESGRYAKYASVRTSAGIWLIGATIELLRPGKTPQTGMLNRPRNSPDAVALPDGSILVAGSEEWLATIPSTTDWDAPDLRTVERVRLNADGRIVSEYVAPVPACRPRDCYSENKLPSTHYYYPPTAACRPVDCGHENLGNFALISIGNGQAMLAGGYENRGTYIYDSAAGNWRKSAPMTERRSNFSLTLLPDGRVLAAGGDKESHDGFSNRGMTTEVWDPKTELWSSGPKLPIPMEGYKSLLVNNKTVILAGGRFAGVLAWDIDKPQWHIAATLGNARASAGVSWLGNGRLAIIGGLHATNYGEAWGRRTEGYSIVDIPREATRSGKPAGLAAKAHASATRGTQTLIAGGTLTNSFDGSEKNEPTSNVELSDSSNGKVRSMPPLPFGALSAKAFWLDDNRVLIMALENDSYRTQLWSDLFDIKSGTHKAIRLPSEIDSSKNSQQNFADVKIAGVHEDRVGLIFDSQYLALLDFTSAKFLPGCRTRRLGFSSRVLSNGKIVVAGGTAAGAHMMFARVANCESCPEVYMEYDDVLPASTYEIFDPIEKKTVTSAQSTALDGPLTILNDGRVAKLGAMIEFAKHAGDMSPLLNKSLLLELSNASGTNWHTLSLPPALRSKGDTVGLRLASLKSPKGLFDSVLLIGILDSNKKIDWWWIDVDSSTPNWQALGLPRVHSDVRAHGVNLGRLSAAGHTYTLAEGGDGIAAFAE